MLTLLFLAIIGNIVALPKHNVMIKQGHMQQYYKPSFDLLNRIRNIDSPDDADQYFIDNFTVFTFFKYKNKKPPDHVNTYQEKGIFYAERCQYWQAIENFNKAIIFNPKDIESYKNRGKIYLKLWRYNLAINDFNKAIKLNPNDTVSYFNRGIAYFRQDNDELGCRDAQKACVLGDCRLLEQARSDKYCQ